jgi:hypothetical protein
MCYLVQEAKQVVLLCNNGMLNFLADGSGILCVISLEHKDRADSGTSKINS